ncbi:hypothetical protein FHU35_12410 [Saccharopolyspora dendranthemae]|uniref:Uncharacterized protein n=1 Tax=Saccharopolyspora dendranthemae TaxID=1181886 RepID=A0A561U7S1_9PSEU|nr:hypothetical protein FHU35_12410 [Saccharopolyspora dendranthemae]
MPLSSRQAGDRPVGTTFQHGPWDERQIAEAGDCESLPVPLLARTAVPVAARARPRGRYLRRSPVHRWHRVVMATAWP